MAVFIKITKEITRKVELHSANLALPISVVNDLIRAHVTRNHISPLFDHRVIKNADIRIEHFVDGSCVVDIDLEVDEIKEESGE